jgi:DNA invertase Pin-like site-specific DNA recombinase
MTCYNNDFGTNWHKIRLSLSLLTKPKLDEEAMREIRRLVVDGIPHEEIWQKLRASRRTFYRYLNTAVEEDRELISFWVPPSPFLTTIELWYQIELAS